MTRKCDCCNGNEHIDERILERRTKVLDKKMDKALQEQGWIMHAVFSEDGIHANNHTHGLYENYDHLDLQATLNIDPKIIHAIFSTMIEAIKNGFTYNDGEKYEKIIHNFPVECKLFQECGRDVLRVIFPDPNGLFPSDSDCDEMYKSQYDILED